MAENKKSFILYADYLSVVQKLPDKEAGELFKHILMYVNDLNPVTDNFVVDIAFEPIKLQMKRDLKKWSESRSAKSESGRLGGIKSGEARRKQNEANEANASKLKQNEANEAVTVNVTVTDNVNVNESEIKEKSFSPISHTFELTIDECKKQYILDDILMDAVRINLKCTNVEILALLDSFTLKLITEGVQSKTLTDFKSHFMRWAKIQTSIKVVEQMQAAIKKKYL